MIDKALDKYRTKVHDNNSTYLAGSKCSKVFALTRKKKNTDYQISIRRRQVKDTYCSCKVEGRVRECVSTRLREVGNCSH